MSAPLRSHGKSEHDVLERILEEVELGMLKGDADRVRTLLAQVDELLEPRWPLESGIHRVVRSA